MKCKITKEHEPIEFNKLHNGRCFLLERKSIFPMMKVDCTGMNCVLKPGHGLMISLETGKLNVVEWSQPVFPLSQTGELSFLERMADECVFGCWGFPDNTYGVTYKLKDEKRGEFYVTLSQPKARWTQKKG